jgi:sulfate anion transporter 2
MPDYSLFFWVLEDAIIISIIAFASSMSLSNIFAKKHKYKVNSNKELFALGMANVIGSFFKCFVCSGTFVQSVILESSGGKSKVVFKLLLLIVYKIKKITNYFLVSFNNWKWNHIFGNYLGFAIVTNIA